MQNNQKIIAIFGGGGFLGKHLMRQLTKLDYRVKVATRNPYLKGYLKPLGNPGQIELFKTNIFNPEDVRQVLKNCDLVINLVGILYETRRQKFDQIHSQFPYLLSNLCNELGIKNLVLPPPIRGRNGENCAIVANVSKNLSEGPNTTEGLKIIEGLKLS